MKIYLRRIVVIVLMGLSFFFLSGVLSDNTSEEQLALVEESIRRATVQYYALEGVYPSTLDDLVSDCGFKIDTEQYYIDYIFIASNLMPDITVLPVSRG